MPGGVAGGEEVGELVVFQAPAGAHQKIVGALRDEAVNGYVVAQTVYYIAAQIHVFHSGISLFQCLAASVRQC